MMESQESVQSTVRESTTADTEGIIKLRETGFNKAFAQGEWNWKFEKHPGNPPKIYVAEADGSIVGLRAFIVERLKIFEKVWLTGLGVEVVVHPDFRRYGIGSQVANESFSQMEDAGIPILVGFPNEAAFKAYSRRRANWKHVCSIPFLVKPLNFDGMLRKYVKNSFLRAIVRATAQLSWGIFFRGKGHKAQDITVGQADDFDDRFDTLWEDVSQQHRISLVRDKAFLHWRFKEKPEEDYVVLAAENEGRLLGYIVLWEGQMFGLQLGFILDILTVNQNVADTLLSGAIPYFRGRGVDAVGCLMLKHTPYFKALRRAGFVIAPKRAIHKEFYFGVQVKPSILPDEIINRRENWFLTFADTDLV